MHGMHTTRALQATSQQNESRRAQEAKLSRGKERPAPRKAPADPKARGHALPVAHAAQPFFRLVGSRARKDKGLWHKAARGGIRVAAIRGAGGG